MRPADATIARARRPHRGGGFTLIELLAVMVIVSVLAAVSIPALSQMDDGKAAAAAKQVLQDLTFARQHAVATGTITWVEFDAGAETWDLLAEDPANLGKANALPIADVASAGDYTVTLNAGEFLGVGITTAVFDAGSDVGFDWFGRPVTDDETPLVATGVVTLTGGHVVNVEVDTGYAYYVAP